MPETKKTAAEPRKPDAVLMPAGWRDPTRPFAGGVMEHVIGSMEDILGGGRANRPAHIRDAAGGLRLVTLDPLDTENYPTGHPKEKTPRYDWVPQDNGLSYGYLKPEGPEDRSAAQTALEEYQAKIQRWKELADKPNSEQTPEERIEFDELNDGLFPGRPEARAETEARAEQPTEATDAHAQSA